MFKEVFSKYSISRILLEWIKTICGYYLDTNTLKKRIRIINRIITILLSLSILLLLSYLLTNHLVTTKLSDDLVTKWKSLSIWDSYGALIDSNNISQNALLTIAFNFIILKLTTISFILFSFSFLWKTIVLVSLYSHSNSLTNKDKLSIWLGLNSDALRVFKDEDNIKRKEVISMRDIMNKFLELQRFPSIEGSRDLIRVENLSFMYHSDNDWDRYLHLFLKKYFPNVYYRHIISKNTRSKEEEYDKENIKALSNINVTIKPSTFTTILGCNGSSKTTFLKAIINLFEKYSGRIVWITKDLKSISHKSFYKHVAYVAQDNLIHNKITVYDYVACGLFPSFSFFKFNYPKDHPLILENLGKMGILKYKDKDMNSLSGGEKQKAILARVLTQKTEVIILDEPTTYLDINNQYLILNLLKKLQKEENKTIITILHDIKQAEQFSDEVILLDNGEVYAFGSTSSVITRENIESVFEVPWR